MTLTKIFKEFKNQKLPSWILAWIIIFGAFGSYTKLVYESGRFNKSKITAIELVKSFDFQVAASNFVLIEKADVQMLFQWHGYKKRYDFMKKILMNLLLEDTTAMVQFLNISLMAKAHQYQQFLSE